MADKDNSEKIIAEAEALSTLEGNPGWEVMERWMKNAIELTKDQLASRKQNTNWDSTVRLQAKYEAYTTLLFLKQRRVDKALELKKKAEESNG